MTHEAYTEISEQVDDALSGCAHLTAWIQECAKFSPIDPAKTLSKGVKSATGRDRAIPYSLAMGIAETSILQHLEAEQAFFGKVKQNVLEPLVAHVNANKKTKANIDKKMRDLVSKIMNGKRKLASDKVTCLKELEEYKHCLADPTAPANVKKLPNAKKKVVQSVAKYEQAVAALVACEKEYNEQIPIETAALNTLERTRIGEIEVRLKALSQLMLERSQDMIAARARLESYVAQLPSADMQHNKLNAQWNNKFGNTPANVMVSYDMPVTSQLLEDAKELAPITTAEDAYQASRSKMDSTIQATNLHFSQIQQQIDTDDKASLVQLNQQAQVNFKALTEQYGLQPAHTPKHGHVLSKDMRDESKLSNLPDGDDGEEDNVLSPNANTTVEEKQKMVAEVQKLFSNANFAAEGRYFVRRGTLTKKCRSKDQDYEFFLFNDMLVYGSKATGSRKLRIHKMLAIDAAFTITDLPPKPSIKQEFAIQCTGKSFVVVAATQQEKGAWVADLAACCEARKNINVEAKTDAAPVFRQDGERDHCPFCKRGFSAFRRKHHCRKCGELCCGDCSPTKILVGGAKPERVCIKCNPEFQIEKKQMEEVARKAASKAPPKPAGPKQAPPPPPATTTSTTTTAAAPTTEATAGQTPPPATQSSNNDVQHQQPPQQQQQQPPQEQQQQQESAEMNAYTDAGVWIPPPEASERPWMESRDSTSGAKYWYNTQTQTSVWVKPEGVDRKSVV